MSVLAACAKEAPESIAMANTNLAVTAGRPIREVHKVERFIGIRAFWWLDGM